MLTNDRVRETSTTTGTGTINLAGAVDGYQTFVAGIGTGNTVFYVIEGEGGIDSEWEIGIGTVTDASPDTLSRTTIIASSNSNNAVNFSAGTKRVFATIPARLLGYRVRTSDATETLLDSDCIVLAANTAARTLTLLPAAGRDGKELFIVKTTANSLGVTVDGNSSETIGGLTTWPLHNAGDVLHIRCDGSNWQLVTPAPEQKRVTTTNNTETTLWSKTLAANTAYMWRVQVAAIRTGGTGGSAGDASWWEYLVAGNRESTNGAGAYSTQVGTMQSAAVGYSVTIDASANDVRVRVTGDTDNNLTWYAKVTPIFVSRFSD